MKVILFAFVAVAAAFFLYLSLPRGNSEVPDTPNSEIVDTKQVRKQAQPKTVEVYDGAKELSRQLLQKSEESVQVAPVPEEITAFEASFDAWLEGRVDEEQLHELALRRSVLMKELIRQDPKSAVYLAFSPTLREELPPFIQPLVESHVSGVVPVEVLMQCISDEDSDPNDHSAHDHEISIVYESGNDLFSLYTVEDVKERGHYFIKGISLGSLTGVSTISMIEKPSAH